MHAQPHAVCGKPVLGLQQMRDTMIPRCLTNRWYHVLERATTEPPGLQDTVMPLWLAAQALCSCLDSGQYAGLLFSIAVDPLQTWQVLKVHQVSSNTGDVQIARMILCSCVCGLTTLHGVISANQKETTSKF